MGAPRLAIGLVALAACGFALGVVLDATGGGWEQGAYVTVSTAIAVLVCGFCGIRVVQHVPRNPVGWVMVAMSMTLGLTYLAELVAYLGLVRHEVPRWLALTALVPGGGWWLLVFAELGLLVMLFPDGRARWPRLPVVLAACLAAAFVGAALNPGPLGNEYGDLANPFGVPALAGPAGLVIAVPMLGFLACLVAGAITAALRFRGARGEQLQQLKWLALVAVLVPLALAACFLGDATLHTDALGSVALPVVTTVVPVALAVAIGRYRLYDIDHLVSRSLSWGLLTATVVATFAAATIAVGTAVGGRSALVTAIATTVALVVGAAARRSVQSWVDRRFDRATTGAVAVVDRFVAGVRDGTADVSAAEMVLREALRDPGLTVAYWLPQSEIYVDAAGTPAVARGELVVGHAEHPVARITRLPQPPDDSHAVRTVIGHARIVLELARARAEVAASRARIVRAGYDERRRLERDLHDGAQQRLVALGVKVRRLQRSLPYEAGIVGPALDQVVDDIADAIADLRRLAAGLRPARLDDGLAPALADLARTTPVEVSFAVEGPRPPDLIEAAAYFVACEGITNAVKHAAAARIDVSACNHDGVFRIVVADDGSGGARFGSGLAGLKDRVAAHGGSLTLTSPAGHGTQLEAQLPCGS